MIGTALSEKPKAIVQGISFRADQLAFIESEAAAQLHGNRSRVVQDAIDLYRQIRSGQMVVLPVNRERSVD
jgi:hypothetical protein